MSFYTPKRPKHIAIILIALGVTLIGFSCPTKADIFHDTKLIRVVDGDTLHIQVKVWPNTIIDTKLRVYGIDTPEKRSKCQAEKDLAQKAKEFTENMTKNGFSVGFATNGKYAGRSIGTIHIPIKYIPKEFMTQQSVRKYVEIGEEPSLGDALVAAGLAVPYFGKKKKDWAAELCPKDLITPDTILPKDILIPHTTITLDPLVIPE